MAKRKLLGGLLLRSLKKKPKTIKPIKKVRPRKSLARAPHFFSHPSPTSKLQKPTKEIEPQKLQHPPSVSTPSAPIEIHALTINEFLKPKSELKQSIEAFLKDQRSPHTRNSYGKDLKRFIKYLLLRRFENPAIQAIDRSLIVGYKDHLLKEKLKASTIDRHLSTLKSFFGWLAQDGVIEKNPASAVKFLAHKRLSQTEGFSDEEVMRILSLPDLHLRTGSLHYAILMVLFYCGLRRSEVCSLRVENLAEEKGHRILKLLGKGNRERILVLVPPAWKAIQHYFYITGRSLRALDEPLFVPVINHRTGSTRKPLDTSMIFYIVRKYARLAQIQRKVSPHSCRATAISNARDHNAPDRAIQEFAGWASPNMITHYDKRRTRAEHSAAHAIDYGAKERVSGIASES